MWNDLVIQGIDAQGNERTFTKNEILKYYTVLYFYPKDNTSGCTVEACDFRDNISRLQTMAMVVGVSPDSVKSHVSFQTKQNLNFILLSDTEHKLAEAFGVWKEKSMYGRKYMGIERSTFVLDEDGNILKEWRKVKVNGHVEEVKAFLEQL